jgi:hypothetical protein
MQAADERDMAAQPTSPRLGRSDSKKKLGVFMKRTYAGVNKQTSKVPNPPPAQIISLFISFFIFIVFFVLRSLFLAN